jgi:hypothetical protein
MAGERSDPAELIQDPGFFILQEENKNLRSSSSYKRKEV